MATPAFRNINNYTISIAGLSNEFSIMIPSNKCVAGNYSAYTAIIGGFVWAADDYLTLDPSEIAYVEVPWTGGAGSSGASGYSGAQGISGYSGYSGIGTSGYSGLGLSGYSGYSGSGGGGAAALATDLFVATDNQTSFTLSNTPMTEGTVFVSLGGNIVPASDYTITGANLVFNSGLFADTPVQVNYWKATSLGTLPYSESFTATASQTDFTLTHPVAFTLVTALNGVVQANTTWSIINNTTLRFVTGLDEGSTVWIAYIYNDVLG